MAPLLHLQRVRVDRREVHDEQDDSEIGPNAVACVG